MWNATAEVEEYAEALKWFRERLPITEAMRDKLDAYASARSWSIAGVAQLDVVLQVHESIAKAIADGTSLDAWKKDIESKLTEAWGKKDSWHTELVFRNATQSAYNAGRYQQMTDPDVLALRPFWEFHGIDDHRQTQICHPLNDVIRPADDPWWNDHIPPLHHACRSRIESLRAKTAREKGITEKAPTVDAAPGFGKAPGIDPARQPDLKDVPEELAKEFGAKVIELKTRQKPEHDPAFWEAEYAHLGDAASTVAHGRASMERGLDGKADDVLAHLTDGPERMQRLHDFVQLMVDQSRKEREHNPWASEVVTLRDMVAELNRVGDVLGEKQVRAAAAISGHIESIDAAGKPGSDAKLPSRNPNKDKAKALLGEANGFFGKLLDKAVDSGNPTIRWESGTRGEYRGNVITTPFRGGVLEHEWGHAFEAKNPGLFKKATAFLDGRTVGETSEKLSKLTGDNRYKAIEIAKKDKFRAAYVGKLYNRPDGSYYATEVTSMGLEWLSGQAGLFYAEDPEHFFFTLGQLKGK